jgi:hypothetical protein
MSKHELGQYTIEDDGTGDLVISHPSNGDVFKYDESADKLQLLKTIKSVQTNETQTKTIGSGEYHYAGDYDGSDPDQRLDAALSAANEGDIIFLENALYDADRTISKKALLLGTGLQQVPSGAGEGTTIGAAWTLDKGRCVIRRIVMNNSASISLTARFTKLISLQGRGSDTPITVSADDTMISQGENLDVTYESGTANGIIDTVTNGTVTDNGSNTVGDFA